MASHTVLSVFALTNSLHCPADNQGRRAARSRSRSRGRSRSRTSWDTTSYASQGKPRLHAERIQLCTKDVVPVQFSGACNQTCCIKWNRGSFFSFSFLSICLHFGDTKSSFALQATPEEVPEPVVEVQVNQGENSLALALQLSQGSGIVLGAKKNYTYLLIKEREGGRGGGGTSA